MNNPAFVNTIINRNPLHQQQINYVMFNEMELEELKVCRELCQKVINSNLFQVEQLSSELKLDKNIFINWVSGIDKSWPYLSSNSLHSIRLLLIKIRNQLQQTCANTQSYNQYTIQVATQLLHDFDFANKNYQNKINDYNMRKQQQQQQQQHQQQQQQQQQHINTQQQIYNQQQHQINLSNMRQIMNNITPQQIIYTPKTSPNKNMLPTLYKRDNYNNFGKYVPLPKISNSKDKECDNMNDNNDNKFKTTNVSQNKTYCTSHVAGLGLDYEIKMK